MRMSLSILYTIPGYSYVFSTSSHQPWSLPSSTFVFHSLLPWSSSVITYFLCSAPYSPHHPTFPASFSFSATILTSLLSSSPSSLFPYISFFPSILSSSFLQPRSPLTAAPGTDLLAPNSRLPTFSWTASKFLFAIFPPGHHISAACSKLGLARSFCFSSPQSAHLPTHPLCLPCPFLCLFFHLLSALIKLQMCAAWCHH